MNDLDIKNEINYDKEKKKSNFSEFKENLFDNKKALNFSKHGLLQ
jgi:hypothetical protein